jgi:acetyl/propionyl-CoA carboxylase alpha subunit
MFKRIAIVNRGEAAMRCIHAVAELPATDAGRPVTVALHTEEERRARFVRDADEALRISAPGNPYLNYTELERALRECAADAAWVGWGFVAEHPEFAELCARINVAFIGPPASVLRAVGDKVGARELAASVGVPVVIDRLVAGARQVEVPIAADREGTVWALGIRDSSIQRRRQTVLAESPSPALGPAEEHRTAAIDAWDAEAALERSRFRAWAARGRPKSTPTPDRAVEFLYRTHRYGIAVRRVSPVRYRAVIDGVVIDVTLDRLSATESRVVIGGRRFRTTSVTRALDHMVEVDDAVHRVSRDLGGLVRAPAPALVVSVPVVVGTQVDSGTPLVVLESMKMESSVRAPYAGRVREVDVAPNMQVDAGTPLVRLDPTGAAPSHTEEPRVVFAPPPVGSPLAVSAVAQCRDYLALMRWQVLGFDATADDLRHTVAGYERTRAEVVGVDADVGVLRDELAVLTAFADVTVLSRNRASGDVEPEDARSPEQEFHRYLCSLDVSTEGLSESFRADLQRALGYVSTISYAARSSSW